MDDIKNWSRLKTCAEVKRKAEGIDNPWRVKPANLQIEDGT